MCWMLRASGPLWFGCNKIHAQMCSRYETIAEERNVLTTGIASVYRQKDLTVNANDW